MTLRHTYPLIFSLLFAVTTVGADGEAIVSSGVIQATGDAYRNAAAAVLAEAGAETRLEALFERGENTSDEARYARILLARVRHPAVFDAFAAELQKWRAQQKSEHSVGERPGYLSGILLQFARRGPESRFVEQKAGWDSEELQGQAGNTLTMRTMRYKKVEKYTDAEVQAGVARNAAARQAVLEHFLKFLPEGSAYEQSEIVDLVYRLWGSGSHEKCQAEPVADVLIEAVYRNRNLPTLARYTAAMRLPRDRRQGVQAFMLDIVTNSSSLGAAKSENLVSGALSYLEASADGDALAVLKAQSDGPDWKRERIAKTVQSIETRLSNSPLTE